MAHAYAPTCPAVDRGPALRRPACCRRPPPGRADPGRAARRLRTSVREAIRVLEAMGVVRAGVGSGPEAGTVVISDPTAALGSALRLHVATQHLPVEDVVETRVLLESWAAARARPDAPELDLAGALLDDMDGGHGIDEFLALDVRFHLALADAAGNAVVSAMMGSLREAIQGYAGQLTANLPDWDATASRLRAEHREILAAIRKGRRRPGGRARRRPHPGVLQRSRAGAEGFGPGPAAADVGGVFVQISGPKGGLTRDIWTKTPSGVSGPRPPAPGSRPPRAVQPADGRSRAQPAGVP
jgi:GntR family transcriptional repressor for pyruvate dehydrogenase complex